ncbi:MAG: ABC transporter ATP-binding protein [Chloroflexota bacterium]
MTQQFILEMSNVRKTFGPIVALDDVNLVLKRGEILGLLGGNGAGKTTLMNVLYGLYKSDSGEIRIDEQPFAIHSPQDAIQGGIGMVHQQFLQIGRFTVVENIVLGTNLRNRPTLDLQDVRERIIKLSAHFGLPVEPDALLDELPMGIRQRVEILKALYRGVRILVLDEPTTNLTPQEVDALFRSLRTMVKEGLSVIFITHKLKEVLDVCDTITVLRNGRNVLTLTRDDASEEAFVRGMVGDEMDVAQSIIFQGLDSSRSTSLGTPTVGQSIGNQSAGPQSTRSGNDRLPKEVLRCRNVTIFDDTNGRNGGTPLLQNCTFTLSEQEILGVAGVAGNGQLALAEGVLGLRPCQSGQIFLNEDDIARMKTHLLLQKGAAYIPEDRWQDGFLPKANVAQNLILGHQRHEPYSNGRFLHWRSIFKKSQTLIDAFNIKTQGPHDTAGNLSGGNIQRVMLARAFSRSLQLLVAHNPTRGLDIPSMEFVYERLLAQREAGMACLLISENMEELFLLCERILVLFEGRMMGILARHEFDAYRLGRLMSGASDGTTDE